MSYRDRKAYFVLCGAVLFLFVVYVIAFWQINNALYHYQIPNVPYFGIDTELPLKRFRSSTGSTVSMVIGYWLRPDLEVIKKIDEEDFNNTKDLYDLNSIASYLKRYGLVAEVHRAKNIQELRRYINHEQQTPIIVVQPFTPEYPGRRQLFRLVIGLDNIHKKVIVHDHRLGSRMEFSYQDFETMWKDSVFPYEYLVVRPLNAEVVLARIQDLPPFYPPPSHRAQKEMWKTRGPKLEVYSNYMLGVDYLYDQKFQSAVEAFLRVTKDPRWDMVSVNGKMFVYIGLAFAYLGMGDFDRAEDAAKHALEFSKDLDTVTKEYPMYYWPLEESASAPWAVLGDVYRRGWKTELARAAYQKALAIYPGNQEAISGLKLLARN